MNDNVSMIGEISDKKVILNNKESLSLNIFYKEVKKMKLLSGDDQIELVKLAKNGDKQAENKLIECNQRFIISIAKDYRNYGLDMEDLISEGNLGLIRSINKYDEDRGVKFLSYAVWWIRQAMLQSIYETADTVRLPVNKINILNKINKIKEVLYQQFGREATFEEVCEKSDLKENEISSVYDGNKSMSIDNCLNDESDYTLMDFISNEDYADIENRMNQDSLIDEINKVFDTLTDREKEIMNMYFGLNDYEPITLKEIGELLGLTNERVRQIKEGATRKLRSHSKVCKLKEFFSAKFN